MLSSTGLPLSEGSRAYFDATVAPGEVRVQSVSVQAPPLPGRYTLLIDLVHEYVRWFDRGISISVEVSDT